MLIDLHSLTMKFGNHVSKNETEWRRFVLNLRSINLASMGIKMKSGTPYTHLKKDRTLYATCLAEIIFLKKSIQPQKTLEIAALAPII